MSGETDEFREFVELRSRALLRTAVLLAGGDQRAGEDLLQDTLVEVYRRWRRISDKGAREAYTRRILVRLATKRWGRRVRHAEPQLLPPGVIEDPQAGTVAALDMKGYLGSLPPTQRAVLVLRYYEDLSEAQIADLLDCPRGTVKSRAASGLQTLKLLIEAADGAATATRGESNP